MDSSTVAILVAGFSLLASIVGNVLQFFKDKKKTDTDAMSQLISKALEMNKQELEVVRIISDDLRKQLGSEIDKNKELESKVSFLENRLKSVELENDNLKSENEKIRLENMSLMDRMNKIEKSINSGIKSENL